MRTPSMLALLPIATGRPSSGALGELRFEAHRARGSERHRLRTTANRETAAELRAASLASAASSTRARSLEVAALVLARSRFGPFRYERTVLSPVIGRHVGLDRAPAAASASSGVPLEEGAAAHPPSLKPHQLPIHGK